ncbi:hypothetical protein [Prosthecobacter sp.]|uniref:hypothetical protein n=1 Tax=Prosthecobacter sp. TaxID=1965333 RepID=UPI002ABA192C|nr:hypothetical protein [Prosthecobacter sp.]MDZ4405447.1 hypothetical protein [Prosthecobacter sp.]
MSSTLWLLLYLAPLLGLTAAVFAWFGWHWRGSDMQKQLKELETPIDNTRNTLHHAEAHARHEQTENELRTLRDDLKSARAETLRCEDETAKARETALALETEVAKLLRNLDHLRTERDHLRTERDQTTTALTTAQAELDHLRSSLPIAQEAAPVSLPIGTEVPAKPKRKRTTPAKPKTTAPAGPTTLREKIAALETRLAAELSSIATLTQERDDWQRRISKLEGKTPADPAGLRLARRSLADSEKRLLTATSEVERLQNQTRVLHRTEEKAAALAHVPDDDLTQIKGIKKVISEQLRAHGIRTWRQIAQWDDDELRAFSELLAFKSRATREQWKEQAHALHETARASH